MTVTEALKKLADVSGEAILLVADPNDGLAVVVRWEDDEKRMAFVDEDLPNMEGDKLALYLISRAANYLVREAQKDVNGSLALRLRSVEGEVHYAVDDSSEGWL